MSDAIRYYAEDDRAVVVTSTGGWIDLKARRLRTPPAELFDVISTLNHSDDFKVLPSNSRS